MFLTILNVPDPSHCPPPEQQLRSGQSILEPILQLKRQRRGRQYTETVMANIYLENITAPGMLIMRFVTMVSSRVWTLWALLNVQPASDSGNTESLVSGALVTSRPRAVSTFSVLMHGFNEAIISKQ